MAALVAIEITLGYCDSTVSGPCDQMSGSERLSQAAARRAARFVVGPECGPVHLAGAYWAWPFSARPRRRNGGRGMEAVTIGLACAPCTAMTSGIFVAGCPPPTAEDGRHPRENGVG